MPEDRKKGYEIYHSILGMILALAIISWVNEYYILKVNVIVCILYALLPAILLFIFDKYKKRLVSYLVLLGLLSGVGFIFYLRKTNPITWISRLIDWVIRYNRTDNTYEIIWAYTTLAFVSVIGCIGFFIIVKRFISRLALAAVIIVMFVVFSIMQVNIGKLAVGIGIFYILNIFIELSGMLYGKRTGNRDKKESILYLIPVCILIAVISAGLPSKSEPIQWTGVKNAYYAIRDQINRLVTEWEFFVGEGEGIFSISLSGYSGDGSLDNDDLVSNDKLALIIAGKRGLSPIYLTGSVNDQYTGFSWDKSKEDFLEGEQEYQMDYAELLYGVSRLDPSILEEYRLIESKGLKIIYNNIRTKTLFYPPKSMELVFDRPNTKLHTESAGITFQKAKGKKTLYSTVFYELNLQEKVFQDMLRDADDFSYNSNPVLEREEVNLIEKKFFVKDRESFFLRKTNAFDLYKERAEIIYNSYTQLPETLPTRVKELAYEITKSGETKYDKLKAIEAYLLGFEYSYTPGKAPEDSDFVDYFLFNTKKGYCTSFATAMAVLGRCIGIPTRYAEGYVVDYEDKDSTGYLVRNSNAHAWAEAYFEGVGWIQFESTPPYNKQRYTAWAPKKSYQDLYINQYDFMEEALDPLVEVPESYVSDVEGGNKNVIIIWLLAIITMIIVVVLILVSYYLILRHRYRKKFDASDNNWRMYQLFLRILTLLRYEGFSLEREDTLVMLSERVQDRYQYEDITFRDAVDIFMGYRYGEIPVTDKQLEKVDVFYKGLLRSHEKESKALKLHLEEFLFLLKR